MRAIYVALPERARKALIELAEREYRDPRDQAAKLLTEALRQAGALADDAPADEEAADAGAVRLLAPAGWCRRTGWWCEPCAVALDLARGEAS